MTEGCSYNYCPFTLLLNQPVSVGEDDADCRVLRQHLALARFPVRPVSAGTRPKNHHQVQAATGESNTESKALR